MADMKSLFKRNELIFLVYFLPIFLVKSFGMFRGDLLLDTVGAICMVSFFLLSISTKYRYPEMAWFGAVLILCSVIIASGGRTAPLLGTIMLLALTRVGSKERIYRICLWSGIFVWIYCLYNAPEVTTNWQLILWREGKHSGQNVLHINYMALCALYVLLHADRMNGKRIGMLAMLNAAVFLQTDSRGGLLAGSIMWLVMYVLTRDAISRNRIVRFLCICTPFLCLTSSFLLCLFYKESAFLRWLNLLLNNRLSLGLKYMERYPITLFGQYTENRGYVGGEYMFLDNSYIDMPFTEGIVFTILWIVVTTAAIRYLCNTGRMVKAALMVGYCIYGMNESILINCFTNISIFCYSDYLSYFFERYTTGQPEPRDGPEYGIRQKHYRILDKRLAR